MKIKIVYIPVPSKYVKFHNLSPFQTPFHSGTKLTIFVAGSWNPKNDSFSSPAKILRVQQLNMHTEYSKFQLPSYCLKMFRGTGQIVAVLGYWSPVNFYP